MLVMMMYALRRPRPNSLHVKRKYIESNKSISYDAQVLLTSRPGAANQTPELLHTGRGTWEL